jgi:hypothetical protein
MCATSRSEGFRVSSDRNTSTCLGTGRVAFFGLVFCWLIAALPATAAEKSDDRQQSKVYSTHFALPASLPAGFHARLVIYNTGQGQARVKLRSLRGFGGETFERTLAAGASLRFEPSWLVPGLPVLLQCNEPTVEIAMQIENGNEVVLESFPIQVVAKYKHDYVLPIVAGNVACPAATPGDAAAATTLTLVPATLQQGGAYELKGLADDGSVVGTAEVPAVMGMAVDVDLAEEFSPEELEDIATVRVESSYTFSGYGFAAVGSEDALGIQPDTRSTWWQTMAPNGFTTVEPISHVLIYNPNASATDVTVDSGTPFELGALETTTIAWPGDEVVIEADLPVVVVEAYAQDDGCGVTAQMSCSNARPWSLPVLQNSTDILVALGPRLGYR